jgi:hypothetical protein
MKRDWLLLACVLAVLSPHGMAAQASRISTSIPARPDPETRYLFYLHGRIVEDQGAGAVSPAFGRYEYEEILKQLAADPIMLISEARKANTDPHVYADSVARQIERLLSAGVPPRSVTVVGASKGAVIAMLVSTRVREPVRYVLLANCNDYVFRTFPLSLHGHVLSIYEASDSLGASCQPLFDRSPALAERSEIRLTTGLKHGFIFRPLEQWVRPALDWARGRATQD